MFLSLPLESMSLSVSLPLKLSAFSVALSQRRLSIALCKWVEDVTISKKLREKPEHSAFGVFLFGVFKMFTQLNPPADRFKLLITNLLKISDILLVSIT